MTLINTQKVYCPYCAEKIEVVVDLTMEDQTLIEDCQVCCRPIAFEVHLDESGTPTLRPHAEDDADY